MLSARAVLLAQLPCSTMTCTQRSSAGCTSMVSRATCLLVLLHSVWSTSDDMFSRLLAGHCSGANTSENDQRSLRGFTLLIHSVAPAPRQAPAQLPPASPEALETLVGMGFDSAQATRALQQSHNDIQTALALLL